MVGNAAPRLLSKIKSTVRNRLSLLIKPTADRSSSLRIKSFGQFSIAYRSETADESVLVESFDQDIFFAGVPQYRAAETDVILDIGAHIGTFSVLAASKALRGKVYAIEACEDTFNYLRINVALNKLDNILPFHLALSDRQGLCTLYYDTGNWGHSTVSRLSRRNEVVECCTLEQFMNAHQIEKCNFVKFNCEGAEFPILLSSHPSLLRRIDMMLVLYHCDLWTKHSVEDLLAHLTACGFRYEITNRGDKRGWIIATNANQASYVA